MLFFVGIKEIGGPVHKKQAGRKERAMQSTQQGRQKETRLRRAGFP
jgi:hypothetical protein